MSDASRPSEAAPCGSDPAPPSVPGTKEKAKKQVHFDIEDLERTPKLGKIPSKLRRRSEDLKRAYIPVESDQGTETVGDEGDDLEDYFQEERDEHGNAVYTSTCQYKDKMIRIRGTYQDFNTAIGGELGRYLLSLGRPELNDDFKQRCMGIAARCVKEGDIAMPFSPLTPEGKARLNDEGFMTYDYFEAASRLEPEALFQEMKLRAVMLAARQQQAEDFHEITLQLDTCVARALAWAHHFGQQVVPPEKQPTESRNNRSNRNNDEDEEDLDQMVQLIDMRDKEIAELKARIASLERGTTPATSIHTVGGTPKSSKYPDPRVFEGGKGDNFEYWLRSIQNKFEFNPDHFPTDGHKRMYVESRVGGIAADNLQPYLEGDHPEKIVTHKQLMDHLIGEYRNPNQKEDAYDEFAELKLEPNGDYHEFKTKFVRLAGQLHKPKAEWKLEFKRRLTVALRMACASEYLDPAVTFEQYSRKAAEISNEFKQARALREKEKGKEKTDRSYKRGGGSGYNDKRNDSRGRGGGRLPNTTPSRQPFERPTGAEAKKLFQERRCFNCREIGHRIKNCPSATVAEVEGKPAYEDREDRVKALLDAQFGLTNTGNGGQEN